MCFIQKLCCSLLIGISLVSCATSSSQLTTAQISSNMSLVPNNTRVVLMSLEELKPPVSQTQTTVSAMGTFRVLNDVYDENASQILIPMGAIFTGLYANNSSTCRIAWKAVYANNNDYKQQLPSFALDNTLADSTCDTSTGVKEGNRFMVMFK